MSFNRIAKPTQLQWKRHLNSSNKQDALEVLLSVRDKLDRDPAICWEWPDYRDKKGYGCIRLVDEDAQTCKKYSVHRLSFEFAKGRIPPGLMVMHGCDNPPCFNPNHLFLGTARDNAQDMVRKGRHGKQRHMTSERPRRRSPEAEAAMQADLRRHKGKGGVTP